MKPKCLTGSLLKQLLTIYSNALLSLIQENLELFLPPFLRQQLQPCTAYCLPMSVSENDAQPASHCLQSDQQNTSSVFHTYVVVYLFRISWSKFPSVLQSQQFPNKVHPWLFCLHGFISSTILQRVHFCCRLWSSAHRCQMGT